MVTLKALLGARSEVHFECMYTKHKTQKRKTWHDGFVSLSASLKLVLFEEMPPEGAARHLRRHTTAPLAACADACLHVCVLRQGECWTRPR